MNREFKNITFPDPLRLEYPVGAGDTHGVKDWNLEEDFRVFWTDGDQEQSYTAKAGLITDMSSIPWFFQGLPGLQKAGRNVRASLIHDDLYHHKGHDGEWSRRDADRLLYHGLRASGGGWYKANQMYLAVRAGGKKVWNT